MKTLTTITTFIALLMSATLAEAARHAPCAWEKQIVAACLILEAANQDEKGMRAVASVIGNRAKGDHSRILAVVKRPFAFTSLNAASSGKTGSRGFADLVRKASRDRHWILAQQIVNELYSSEWSDITYGADHYVRRDLRPSWTRQMAVTAVIGAHTFYKSDNRF